MFVGEYMSEYEVGNFERMHLCVRYVDVFVRCEYRQFVDKCEYMAMWACCM